MNPTDLVDRSSLRDDVPAFAPGDALKVHVRVVEGTRERVQVFQGAVIRRQGSGVRETFTVRKISFGVGVERTFPSTLRVIATVRSCPGATSAGPSSTTCATGRAKRRKSRRSGPFAEVVAWRTVWVPSGQRTQIGP